MSTRLCSKCELEKPLAEFYGDIGYCKPCHSDYSKAWNAANPGRKSAAIKAWFERNPDKKREYQRRKTQRDRERRLADPAYAQQVRERDRKRYRRRAGFQEDLLNPKLPIEERFRRKKMKSSSLKLRLLLAQKYRCIGCKKLLLPSFEVDHKVPLARGGTNDHSNLQLLCQPCNLKKRDGLSC